MNDKRIEDCPKCSIYFEPKNINFTIVNMLGKIKVKCLNNFKDSGCNLTCLYKDLNNHLLICDYSQQNCSCGSTFFNKDYIEHMKVCNYVKTPCKFCYEQIALNNTLHYENCKEIKTQCKFCKTTLKAINMKSHLLSKCKLLEYICYYCKEFSAKIINEEDFDTVYYCK